LQLFVPRKKVQKKFCLSAVVDFFVLKETSLSVYWQTVSFSVPKMTGKLKSWQIMCKLLCSKTKTALLFFHVN